MEYSTTVAPRFAIPLCGFFTELPPPRKYILTPVLGETNPIYPCLPPFVISANFIPQIEKHKNWNIILTSAVVRDTPKKKGMQTKNTSL